MQVGRDAELRGHVLRDDRPGGGQSGAGAVPGGAVASEGGSMINRLVFDLSTMAVKLYWPPKVA